MYDWLVAIEGLKIRGRPTLFSHTSFVYLENGTTNL